MARRERLHQRRLTRPLREDLRRVVEEDFARRRSMIPVPAELVWEENGSAFAIRALGISFHIHFTEEWMLVDAELSLAAQFLATRENRRQVVRFIDTMSDDLGL